MASSRTAARAPATLLLRSSEIALAAPPFSQIVALVEEVYRAEARGEIESAPKSNLHPRGPRGFLHAMPAWAKGQDALGVKWISYFPDNAARGLPDSSGLLLLNDPESGLPAAVMEGMWITLARTSACAAVAARHLAARPPVRLGLVGCGQLARWSLRMLSAVLPTLTEVRVSSARPDSRHRFCKEMALEGPWTLTPVDHVRQAVEDVDLIVSSTPKLETAPIADAWWSPGTVLIPLDVAGAWGKVIYHSADRVICDGVDSLRQAISRYRPEVSFDPARVTTTQSVVAGTAPGRTRPQERILAFVAGVAAVDMVLARRVFQNASGLGLGLAFDFTA